jgi:hypothetical protein
MKLGGEVRTETVLLSFVEAELDSPNRRDRFVQALTIQGVASLLAAGPSNWSASQRQLLLYILGQVRGMFILPLLAQTPRWFEATIQPSELSTHHATAGAWWGNLSPNWELRAFIDSFEAGQDTPDGGFRAKVYELASKFDLTKQRGRPILVGSSEAGMLTVLEGTTRLLAVLKRQRDGLDLPEWIPIYCGLSPQADQWMFRR